MSSNLSEPLEAERSRKRTASDLEEEKSASLEDETQSSSKETSLPPRKKNAPSSLSAFRTWSECGDESDSSCTKSQLASSKEGNFSASHWTYKDLIYLNIYYEDMPDPLETFIKDVKDAFRNEKGFCPDPSKLTNFLKKELEKSLTFTHELRKFEKLVKKEHRETQIEKVKKEIKENMEMTWKKCDVLFDFKSLDSATEEFVKETVTLFNVAVRDFAEETLELLGMGIFQKPKYASQEKERGKNRGGRARGGSRGGHDNAEYMSTTENICQHYCRAFGNIFFLREGFLCERSFTFNKQTVRNTPDLIYHYHSGKTMEELLFIIEVKKVPLNLDTTDIRQLVGKNIMGQVGGELLGQSQYSVFYPHSLGIICMETKLIFVLLKMSKEHSEGLFSGDKGTADDPGKIHYTEPFDILRAEDRSKIAEFMFWLGLVQNTSKYKYFESCQ
ncbi:uncharacterized protein LOC133177144 [Saccostrea echinata]|uniref:uncharacterized protein LOC133177144 n=1 Tax=Saccostrea echinata TaxID=191078 RepID=UPI002A813572|nr:uncharacterized protein LOC133177144 [Saccostrea echinata]